MNTPKTIGRNQTQKIVKIWAKSQDGMGFSLSNHFIGEAVDVSWIQRQFEMFKRAKLTQESNNTYRLRMHSNEWYTFRSEP